MCADPLRTIAAAALLGLFALPTACDAQVCCLLDPVVTHTNGVRLASSTPQRSHNMYWQCDPLHLGYCGGQMHGPCRSDLRSIGTRRPCGCFPLPPGPMPGPVGSKSLHAQDGLELDDGERLGSLPMGPFPVGAATGTIRPQLPRL